MLNGKSILVTGGTGSFGKEFVKQVLERFPRVKRLIVFSRDELKQHEMARIFSREKYAPMRYFLGDVRDKNRLKRAFEGVEVVVHAAALKQVPVAEYNPMEFIRTNITGAENVIEAAIDVGVKKVVALSTDKAVAPVNLYGATKLCSDKLFVAANYYAARSGFAVVRYGNILGSRGSVVPLFLEESAKGYIPCTDKGMTRFSLTLSQGVEFVLRTLETYVGGEIWIPKIPSYRLGTLIEAIGPNCKIEIIGVRPGEKLHEELISENDCHNVVDLGSAYAILPQFGNLSKEDYLKQIGGEGVKPGFRYGSDNNSHFLDVKELRELIRVHVDPKFRPT